MNFLILLFLLLIIGVIFFMISRDKKLGSSFKIFTEEIGQMCLGIGIGIAMVIIVTFTFLSYITSDIFISVGFAVIISAVPYFIYIFPNVTALVPDDRAWVIINKLGKESNAELKESSGYREPVKWQRECQAGLHWKYFWEQPSKSVDMTRSVTITNPANDRYKDGRGNIFQIEWRLAYVPLRGGIVQYISSRPDLIKTIASDRVRKFLQSVVGEKTDLGYGERTFADLKKAWETEYGNKYTIDDEFERPSGIQTFLEIIGIDELGTAQEMSAILRAVKEIVGKDQKMTFDDAYKLVLASRASGVDVDLLQLQGKVK